MNKPELIQKLKIEYDELTKKIHKIDNAINNDDSIPNSHKSIMIDQFNAMHKYRIALRDRIEDLEV